MRKSFFIIFVASMLLPGCNSTKAEDLKKIVTLSGYWKFSIGDDKIWASPDFNDSDWDQLRVPASWENEGYADYNGFAWYRKSFRVDELPADKPLYLLLGKIDDADEVFINGKKVGKSGDFPPHFETAYDKARRYNIAVGLLKPNAVNTIAVRVYDTYMDGGILFGPVGIYISADDDFLDLDLSGKWKFHKGQNSDWKAAGFDDSGWKEISVPSEWEQEGYSGYDGYACYRKTFRLPAGFNTEDIYLSLGKIDDEDDVYLNGVHVGSVFDLPKSGEYRFRGYEYNARRIYKIPANAINKNGVNVISIRVYDGQLRGGIYEGPVGIMNKENYRRYMNKYQSNQSFWDYLYDQFVD